MKLIQLKSIEKIWVLEKLTNNIPERDKEIHERFEKALRFTNNLKSNKQNKDIENELFNPLNYIGYRHPAIIDSLFEDPTNNKLKTSIQSGLVADFRKNKSAENLCVRKLPKNQYQSGNIINLKLDDIENPDDDVKELLINKDFECRVYIKEYVIEARIMTYGNLKHNLFFFKNKSKQNTDVVTINDFNDTNLNEDSIFIQPLNYPANYHLNPNIQILEEFKQALEKLPKAEFFPLTTIHLNPLLHNL